MVVNIVKNVLPNKRSEGQVAQDRIGSYLTFNLTEKDEGIVLKFCGRMELRSLPGRPPFIKGAVNPWGCDIPIIDLQVLYHGRPTPMTTRACIVLFEYHEPHKCYFGTVVGNISSVLNIADGSQNQKSPLLLSAELAPLLRFVGWEKASSY